jgi:hypothetical protein
LWGAPVISVKDNVREVLSFTDRLSSQYEFAAAKALTDTVRQVAAAMPTEAEKALDRPTQYTRNAFYFERAQKTKLVAWVGIKPVQATYLQWQIYGGDRFPTRKALKLPGEITLDGSGNIRRADLKRLIAQAKSERKRVRKGGGKTSYSGKSKGVFYGQPANRPGLPAGIYRRVEADNGNARRFLQPLVLFPARSARYEQRFDFFGKAKAIVLERFEPLLRRSWAQAKASAR